MFSPVLLRLDLYAIRNRLLERFSALSCGFHVFNSPSLLVTSAAFVAVVILIL